MKLLKELQLLHFFSNHGDPWVSHREYKAYLNLYDMALFSSKHNTYELSLQSKLNAQQWYKIGELPLAISFPQQFLEKTKTHHTEPLWGRDSSYTVWLIWNMRMNRFLQSLKELIKKKKNPGIFPTYCMWKEAWQVLGSWTS